MINVLADMAVRVARAEIERDQALAEAEQAREWARQCREASSAVISGDKERLLRSLHIIGIPARDLVDIYAIEDTWRREGGSQALLDWWRDQKEKGTT